MPEEELSRIRQPIQKAINIAEGLSRDKAIQKKLKMVDVEAIVKRLIEEIEPANPSVNFVIDCPKPRLALCSSRDFERVFYNIISNAIESRNQSPLSVRISISKPLKPDQTLLTVEDNGRGISSENLGKVFAKNFSAGKDAGTGLGLYHAKLKMDEWQGSISMDSKLGIGSKVSLLFSGCDADEGIEPSKETV